MRAALAFVLACQLACTSTTEVVPAALVFPRTMVGHPLELPLPRLADGTALPDSIWRVERPFDVRNDPLKPRAGGNVRFLALAAGRFETTLRGTYGGRDYAVPVRAEAEACTDDASCDDGIACTRSRCHRGSCSPHMPNNSFCPQAAPCQVSRCDPRRGCVVERLPEGARCVINTGGNCTAFSVCAAGACVPPDGTTPACTGAAPVPLAPVWTYTPTLERGASRALLLHVVSNDLLESAFLERKTVLGREGRSTGDLVSLDADGHERFRIEEVADFHEVHSQSLIGDLFVFYAELHRKNDDSGKPASASLAAYRWSDGTRAWTHAPSDFVSTANAIAEPIVRLAGSDLFLTAYRWGEGEWHPLRVDAATGASRELSPSRLPGWRAIASDGDGRLVFWGREEAVALDEDQHLRWQAVNGAPPVEFGEGLALDHDTLLLGDGRVLDARSGRPLAPWRSLSQGRVRSSNGRLWSLSGAPGCSPVRVETAVVGSAAPVERCVLPPAAVRGGPVLTARGSLLVITADDAPSAQLWEVAPGGHVLQAATLPSRAVQIAGLRAGRILVADDKGLAAYDLPQSVDLAPSGWVAEGGSFARDGVPR